MPIISKSYMFTFKWTFFVAMVLLASDLYCQPFKRDLNQYDENGKRKGLWITYWDEEKKIPMSLARFENGYEKGVSKEYHPNGILRLKFRYHQNRIHVKYFNENRKLEQKGWSVIEYNAEDTHYYWQGKWKFYDQKRKLTKEAYYQQGEEITLE